MIPYGCVFCIRIGEQAGQTAYQWCWYAFLRAVGQVKKEEGENEMKSFLIIGLGRFGTALAQELTSQGNEVLAVDLSPDRVQAVADQVTQAASGDARDPELLKGLGARNFDCAVVSIGGDVGSSALVTLNLRELGVSQIISKANSLVHYKVLEKIGADLVIFPEQEMALRLAHGLSHGSILNLIELSGSHSIVEKTTPKKWVGRSITELDIRAKWNLNIIAVRQEDHITISPGGNYVLGPRDCLVILGHNTDIDRLERM